MRYVYGPVPSRRLGASLGINLIPSKTCSFNCVYCQVQRTTDPTVERREYVPINEILTQLKEVLGLGAKIDYIALSGTGEPTLNSKIGELIHEIKAMTRIPVAVLTNSSLLSRKEVRDGLMEADLVLPSLDAATREVFQKINRPHQDLRLDEIIKGIRKFILEFNGEVWLEVMLVKGFNDSQKEMSRLSKVIARLGPKKIQLNTVVRPPCEEFARALTYDELFAIKDILGDKAEII